MFGTTGHNVVLWKWPVRSMSKRICKRQIKQQVADRSQAHVAAGKTKPKIHYISRCIGGYQNSMIHETIDLAPSVSHLRASRGRLFQVFSYQKPGTSPRRLVEIVPSGVKPFMIDNSTTRHLIGRDNTGRSTCQHSQVIQGGSIRTLQSKP